MSLYYNRDRNITGVSTLTGFSFSPEYGSSVTFESSNNYFSYSDRGVNIQPHGVNSIVGKFDLKLKLRESGAQSLINFYESRSGTGIFAVSDNSNIYRTLSGTIDNIDLSTQNNDKYDVGLSFYVERNASPLKWSGQAFLNHSFVKWSAGQSFSQDDVVYFEHDLEEPTNNFFYCLSSHTSSLNNHPLSTGNLWTANLFLNPNAPFSVSQKPLVVKNEFRGAYVERIKDQKNVHSLESLELSYQNISDKKLKSLLHFLEGKLGYKKFQYQTPEIYNRPKVFFAPTWTHEWNYKDSNNLKISAIEDPFGMIPSGEPSAYIVQSTGKSFLSLFLTGNGNLFYDTGNGKQLISSRSNNFSWSNSGIKNTVKIYGRLAGLTGLRQGIERVQLSSQETFHLNMSGNSLSTLNLYKVPNLQRINCSDNMVAGFDFFGQSGLIWADITNNSGSYLNIAECTSLTGLYASGNRFPRTHVDGSLKVLADAGRVSGYANFSGSSGISPDSLSYVRTLTGRFWNIGYQYTPVTTTTTTSIPTTTLPPNSGYSMSLGYASDYSTACAGGTSVSVLLDASSFGASTSVNFSGEGIIQSGNSSFVLSDGSTFKTATKICCNIATLVDGGFCVVTTVPPPTTTSITTSPPTTIPFTTAPLATTPPPP